MSFGKMPIDDLLQIANAGGGLRLDAAQRYPDELMQLATAAKNSGATVIFYGMSRYYTNQYCAAYLARACSSCAIGRMPATPLARL